MFRSVDEVRDGTEGKGRGTNTHANATVAFLDVFMAAADGVFGLERHSHVAAVAAAGVDFVV